MRDDIKDVLCKRRLEALSDSSAYEHKSEEAISLIAEEIITDSELEALMSRKAPYVEAPFRYQLGQTVIALSLQEFYETFLSFGAPMDFLTYYRDMPGYRDVRGEPMDH